MSSIFRVNPRLAATLAALVMIACGTQAEEDQPTAGPPVVLRGPYLCRRSCFYEGQEHIGVLYALDGSEEIQAMVKKVMEQYPGPGLDLTAALKFQELLDRELRYYIEPNEVEQQVHRECEFWNWPAEVTGTVSVKDGQKWITPTQIRPNFSPLSVPEKLLQPDKPLVMPQREPIELKINEQLSIRCVPIPAGSFLRGSPFYQVPRCHDEYPHETVLTKDFYLAETPTTQEVFEAVMGHNPTPEDRRGPQNPVENVLWEDLLEFCRRVSEKTGRTVRLPTGAEFEYAARVGTSDACFPAKYQAQKSDIGHKGAPAVPVKTKQPNAWGCYDMLTYYGWHACSDYDGSNPTEKQIDPQGPPAGSSLIYFKGAHRALGGDQYGVRPNIHYWYHEGPKPEADGHWVGIFRVVVEVEERRNP